MHDQFLPFLETPTPLTVDIPFSEWEVQVSPSPSSSTSDPFIDPFDTASAMAEWHSFASKLHSTSQQCGLSFQDLSLLFPQPFLWPQSQPQTPSAPAPWAPSQVQVSSPSEELLRDPKVKTFVKDMVSVAQTSKPLSSHRIGKQRRRQKYSRFFANPELVRGILDRDTVQSAMAEVEGNKKLKFAGSMKRRSAPRDYDAHVVKFNI